jgi:hypothetical protein
MKKTKVILLRGEENSGKTTTMHLVRKELWSPEPARYYRVPFDKDAQDFAIVINHNGKNIGLISHGDDATETKIDLQNLLDMKVDIIVGSTSDSNRGGAYKVYTGEARVEIISEELTEPFKKALQQAKNQCEVATDIINKIEEHTRKA